MISVLILECCGVLFDADNNVMPCCCFKLKLFMLCNAFSAWLFNSAMVAAFDTGPPRTPKLELFIFTNEAVTDLEDDSPPELFPPPEEEALLLLECHRDVEGERFKADADDP